MLPTVNKNGGVSPVKGSEGPSVILARNGGKITTIERKSSRIIQRNPSLMHSS